VNETELSTISGRTLDADNQASLQSAIDEARATPSQAWIVTLGPSGILLSDGPGSTERTPGHEVSVKDTTGAGDCFVGVLAAEVATGRDLLHAATTANAAAALCVQGDGAGPSMPTADAVSNFIGVPR
jgi:ribokinase